MRKNLFIFSTFILIIIFVSTSFSQSTKTSFLNDKFALVEGHKVHYQTGGAGNVTVVFESGHGDDMHSWVDVYPEVAKFAKVFRYDREGYGLSDSNTAPTSYKQIAERLYELLQNANVKPPCILIGHSLGGALIRAFTFTYPNEISGLVFVDPFNEYESAQLTKEQRTHAVNEMDSSLHNVPTTFVAEWQILKQEFFVDSSEINSFGALPDVPVVLFAPAKNRPPGWEQSERDFFQTECTIFTKHVLLIFRKAGITYRILNLHL